MLASTVVLFTSLACSALAAPVAEHGMTKRGSAYPFSRVVAFGDNLSDNGNGSVKHGVADYGHPNNKIYGYGTWTDGPVAVSYLVDMLQVPLAHDYAWGHEDGGSKVGATIDNNYTQSLVPSAKDQIENYSKTDDVSQAQDTLYFLWIGNNDINLYHIKTSETDNSQFGTQMAGMMVDRVQSILDFGAPYVFVPALYPKQISPSSKFYADSQDELTNLQNAIEGANEAIKSSLTSQFGNKVIYYDVYSFMMNVWNNHDQYGITHVGGQFCDGYSQQDWNECVTDGQGSTFYWMQFLDMTTTVHQLIAQDMFNAIKSNFGVSS